MSRTQVFPTAEEWKNKRPFQIGASEVATIVGVSKYGSIAELWNRKVNNIVDSEENEAMLWGHAFEDGVARLFEEKTGYEVIKSSIGDWQFVNDDEPWMSCSPDRTYWLGDKRNAKDWSQKGLLECKTTVIDPEDEKNDWLLKSWFCQVQWQLMVAEMEEAHLCCAVFGYNRKTVIRHWTADKAFQEKLKNIVSEFWYGNVIGKVAPEARKIEDVAILFPREKEGVFATADTELMTAVADMKAIRDNIKILEEQEEALKSKIILSIGDAEGLKDENGAILATYKATKDSKTFDSRAFKANHPDLYENYLVDKAGSRRFLIK